MAESYPLHWPAGWPRTGAPFKQDSRYRFRRPDGFWTFSAARDALMKELAIIGAGYVVLSSNYELRRDGKIYAKQRAPDDTGIAVYFVLHGVQKAMACDLHVRAEVNMRSIALCLQAMRQLDRHGGGRMMEAAFEGFTALPAPGAGQTLWWSVLGFNGPDVSEAALQAAYRQAAVEASHAGDQDRLKAINVARDEGLKAIGGGSA